MYSDHFCPLPILPPPSPTNPMFCPLYWFKNPSLICTGCKSLGVWSPLEHVEQPGATCLEKRFSSQWLLHKGLDLCLPPTSSCWDSVGLELAQVLHMLSNPCGVICTSALSCLENTVPLSLRMCSEIWAIKLVNRLTRRQAKRVH